MISFPRRKSDDSPGEPEQPRRPPAQPPAGGESADTNPREGDAAAPPTPPAAAPLTSPKPPWSVLSAADLDEAIRRGGRTDDPARLRQEAQRAERERVSAEWAREDRAAEAAKAERDRHRNVWETT